MQSLCDVNVLFSLVFGGHVHHVQVYDWVARRANHSLVLCRQTQLSLLRLLTTRQILQEQVCTMAQAWSLYWLLLNDSRFIFSSEPSTFDIVFHQTSNLAQVSPKLWQDTYLAAFAISGKLSLVTFDQGFRQYSGLSVDILH